MRMLAFCRNSRGFTLLELLVVLGLMSLVTAVALPGLVNLYDAMSRNVALDSIGAEINGLGRRAYESGAPITLSKESVNLPEGWQLATDSPIVYSAKGACRGGTLRLMLDGELVRRITLKAPYCRVGDET